MIALGWVGSGAAQRSAAQLSCSVPDGAAEPQRRRPAVLSHHLSVYKPPDELKMDYDKAYSHSRVWKVRGGRRTPTRPTRTSPGVCTGFLCDFG